MTRDNDTRDRTDRIFHQGGVKPHVLLEIDRLVTLYSFVEMGTAASIVSDALVKHIQSSCHSVCFYKLDSPLARREIYVAYKRSKYYSRPWRHSSIF